MKLDFDKMGGLVPAIIQDADTRKVLMLGFMNEAAYNKTVETKKVTFFSRTRNTLWTKGETSGNFLNMVSMAVDCDNDTLLIQAHPVGPVCHTGTDTCWGDVNSADLSFLASLQTLIEERKQTMPEGSYTAKLFSEGVNRMAQMVGEESLSTLIAATHGTNEQVLAESADLVYHLMVLLTSKGMRIEDVVAELHRRRHESEK